MMTYTALLDERNSMWDGIVLIDVHAEARIVALSDI